ncbi:MAG: hypothetical protein ACUZ77_11830 [Candidatus Brocadiales bacterium]
MDKKSFIKKEFIPDNDNLYRRVRPRHFDPKTGKISSASFLLRPKDKGRLSVNWERYSTPEKSAICPRCGEKFLIGGLQAKIPRYEQLEVNHAPSQDDKSHSLISGQRLIESNLEVAVELAEKCRPLITTIL